MSHLNTVRFVAHQQHLQLLGIVDQELAEAAGQRVLGFLVAPVTDVGQQDLALEPFCTLLLVPLGSRQSRLIFMFRSDWCLMNFLVLFLTILGFTRGRRAAMMPFDKSQTQVSKETGRWGCVSQALSDIAECLPITS